GKIADLVLWEPAFFGAKPKIVIKNGFISWAVLGDPNASLPTPQPTYYRPMFGAYGDALAGSCLTFVSGAAHAARIKERLRVEVREVMIVHLDGLRHVAPGVAMRTCVELGHAMGNQHWPSLVKGDLVYVPLTVDRRVMASIMQTHHFEGIRYEFVSGREV